MKTGVKPPQNDHNGKRRWTSEQKIGGGVQMHLWKRSLEHREFFAEWMVKTRNDLSKFKWGSTVSFGDAQDRSRHNQTGYA